MNIKMDDKQEITVVNIPPEVKVLIKENNIDIDELAKKISKIIQDRLSEAMKKEFNE